MHIPNIGLQNPEKNNLRLLDTYWFLELAVTKYKLNLAFAWQIISSYWLEIGISRIYIMS